MTTSNALATIPSLLPQVRAMEGFDWNDLSAVQGMSEDLLTRVSDPDVLASLCEAVAKDSHLLTLCEHYDILDKVVLYDSPSGWRLRLHVFLPGYFDRPHNHRWTYSSHILSGSYTHTLFGSDEELPDYVDTAKSSDAAELPYGGEPAPVAVERLTPRLVRTEKAGTQYTLHHSMIHSVTATPYTTSLIVRGPAVKDRFLVTDRVTGQAWWQYGSASESREVTAQKSMSPERLQECLGRLRESKILGS